MDRRTEPRLNRIASIKETGEEISQDEWARFDAAVEEVKAERNRVLQRVDQISDRDEDDV